MILSAGKNSGPRMIQLEDGGAIVIDTMGQKCVIRVSQENDTHEMHTLITMDFDTTIALVEELKSTIQTMIGADSRRQKLSKEKGNGQ